MFLSKVLLTSVLVSLTAVDASPLSRNTGKATLSIAARFNPSGTLNVVERDRAHVESFKNADYLGKRSTTAIGVTNAVMWYTAQIGIGSPSTEYTLVLDTGTANTWIGAGKPYTPTSTSQDTGNTVSVTYEYGNGFMSGEEWFDEVTVADLAIPDQMIGVASTADGFPGVDGVLGLGPSDLSDGTVASMPGPIPTVLENLFNLKMIPHESLGVYFVPASEQNSNGMLTFGGADESFITSPIHCVPITTTSPASKYWGFDMSITYGGNTILSTNPGIIDTGTIYLYLASDAFQVYQNATGATFDPEAQLFAITPAQYSALQILTFNIGGQTYELLPNAQIWPRSLNSVINGTANMIYLIIGELGTSSGSGLDFILGYTFLERFYTVLDGHKGRIGFATTGYTGTTTN